MSASKTVLNFFYSLMIFMCFIKVHKRHFFTLSELPALIVNKNFLECWTKEGNVKNSNHRLILLGGATGHGKR